MTRKTRNEKLKQILAQLLALTREYAEQMTSPDLVIWERLANQAVKEGVMIPDIVGYV